MTPSNAPPLPQPTRPHQGFSANLYTTVSDVFPKRAVASVTGLGGFAGSFQSYGAGSTLSYRLTEMLHLTSQLDVRRFNSSSSGFNRLGTRVALGLSFSPGKLPLSLR